MATQQLLIIGKVQGVFYRASAKKIADELSIKGWIKNLPDGNVEALILGEATALNRFVAWCHKGPDGAVVEKVIVHVKNDLALITADTFSIIS